MGDQRAQAKLYELFAPKMFGVCLRYAKDSTEAEDNLQEGFYKVFTNIKGFRHEGSLEGWIRRIMVNTSLDQIRRETKFQDNIAMEQVDYKIEQQGHILEGLMDEDLLKLISEMPDGYKTVFNMFAIEGYSHKEIGEMLGISENTSKSQLSRARKHLQDLLLKFEMNVDLKFTGNE